MPQSQATLSMPAIARSERGDLVADSATWRALLYYALYRVVLSVFLLLGSLRFADVISLGTALPEVAQAVSITYFGTAVLLGALAVFRQPGLGVQLWTGLAADVVAISLLMHASGGVRSGLAMLLMMSVAGAVLISRGGWALAFAALAALGVLAEQFFMSLRRFDASADALAAGLTSAGFFAVAMVSMALARYARASQQIAEEREIDLADLAKLNALVVRDMADGFLVIDGEGIIRQHNPRVTALLGDVPRSGELQRYSPQLAERLTAWRLTGDDAQDAAPLVSAQTELNVRFVDIGSERRPATVAFLEDASRVKREAQQLKLAALGRLTASIAHEIRNPLSSINHAAELLDESESRVEGDERLLRIIRDNVGRLDRLVEEVLALSRRDRGSPESVDMHAYLQQFAESFASAESVSPALVSIDAKDVRHSEIDRGHLDQIVWNLVRNAVRHSSGSPGAVEIRYRAPEDSDVAELLVKDDGPGVPPEAEGQLFEPFFTTDARGTGLGLYMARQLAEANGGTLEYVGSAKGAIFRLRMRAKQP